MTSRELIGEILHYTLDGLLIIAVIGFPFGLCAWFAIARDL